MDSVRSHFRKIHTLEAGKQKKKELLVIKKKETNLTNERVYLVFLNTQD